MKIRIYLFFFFVFTLIPSIYFFGIFILFERLPFEVTMQEHIEVYHSVINQSADPRFRAIIILALFSPLLAFVGIKKLKGEFGSASFANRSQIKKMGLFAKDGISLAKYGSKILRYTEKLAVLVLAPPGTGKTAGVSIPNLLTSPASAFVLDIKGELFNKTSNYRKEALNSKIYKFNPADIEAMKFNPFDKTILKDLSWSEKEKIVDQVSFLIYPEKEHHDHWTVEGRSLFVMFALYLVYKNDYSSIPDIRELIISNFALLYGENYDFDSEIEAFLHFIKEEISENEELPLRIREEATSFLRKEAKELSSVISSCKSPLSIFATSTVRECFRSNDLNIKNFREETSTLYISIAEDDLKRFEVLLRIFIEFNLRILLSNEPKKSDIDILLMLDEFPRFGKIPYLVTVPELGRSYKLLTLLIAQDYGQIEEVYGKSMISRLNTSTAYKVIFPQTNPETAELTSKLIGEFTRETVSESKSQADKGNTNKSYSTQLSGQALISKQDILNMNENQVYVLAKNYYKHPIKAKPYLYFEDKKLKKRANNVY